MKFSIITVCYNAAECIAQTIDSVVKQYSEKYEIEYIIIDGKSNDGTVEIIDKNRRNISFFSSEKDTSIYNAMNKGLKRVTGDVVAFLNAGDVYEAGALNTVYEAFINNDTDGVIGKEILSVGEERYSIDWHLHDSMETFRIADIFCHQAAFFRAELFDKIGGFDEQYRIAADYDWMLKVYLAGYKILEIPEYIVSFDRRGISFVQAYITCIEARKVALSYTEEDDTDRIQKINEFYKTESHYKSTLMRLAWLELSDEILGEMKAERGIYIWGTGMYGFLSFCRIQDYGIRINGFIDSKYRRPKGDYSFEPIERCKKIGLKVSAKLVSDGTTTTFMDYPVMKYEDIPEDAFIFVGVNDKTFETEIVNEIEKRKIHKYITYNQFIDKLVDYGTKNCSQKVILE